MLNTPVESIKFFLIGSGKVSGKQKKEFRVAQMTKIVTPSSRSIQLTKKSAEEFYQDVSKGKQNFDTLAKEKNIIVQTSGDVTRDGTVPLAGQDKSLLSFMFDNKVGTITEPVKAPNGYIVYEIIQKNPEGYQNFDSVKTTMIKPKVINEKKFQILNGITKDLEGKISNGDLFSLKSIAPQYLYETADSFTVSKPNPKIGQDYALSSAVQKLKPGEISKPVKGAKGYYIVKLNSITEFKESEYILKANDIRKNLLSSKRQQIVSEWLTKMQSDADIIDNRSKYLN